MKLLSLFLLILLLVLSSTSVIEATKLREIWKIDSIFKSPESVIYDSARDVLYVSNVNGYSKNGKGFISKLSPEGDVLDLIWISGLDAPTGMGIYDDRLYIANLDELIVFHLSEEIILARYAAPDIAPLLNDVAISPAGTVYVTASRLSKIYVLEGGRLQTWLEDKILLKDANGLIAGIDYLISAAYFLTRIDTTDLSVVKITEGENLVDPDGIDSDGLDGYFVSFVGKNIIGHYNGKDSFEIVLERDYFTADFDFVEKHQKLYAAGGNNSVTAFEVTLSSGGGAAG
ncbi:hypothetical protein L0222_05755 [bacterium]|nr:hypothetical protein [bacterium]